MGNDKKTFDVRGVQLGASRSMDQVAAELTEKMNTLNGEGYSVQVLHVDDGLLVVGRLLGDNQDSPFARLINSVLSSRPDDDDDLGLPTRVASLLASVTAKIPGDWRASFENEMPKVLPSVLKDAPLNMISEVAQECEDCATNHEKTHDHREGTECTLPRILRAMAKGMRAFAQQNFS